MLFYHNRSLHTRLACSHRWHLKWRTMPSPQGNQYNLLFEIFKMSHAWWWHSTFRNLSKIIVLYSFFEANTICATHFAWAGLMTFLRQRFDDLCFSNSRAFVPRGRVQSDSAKNFGGLLNVFFASFTCSKCPSNLTQIWWTRLETVCGSPQTFQIVGFILFSCSYVFHH